jgi:DNA repair photolyase
MAKLESLFPILNEKTISPLARRAELAPLESTGCLTEYRPLESRSIVSRVVSNRRLPFTHAINPYRGCEFACRYCYARYTHEFLEKTPEDFEHKIYFKQNAAWLLRQELKRLPADTQISIGTATDPYQPIERKQRITRSILEVFAQTDGLRLGIVTKSTLILRDLDILKEIAQRHRLVIHNTVTTTDERLARILEPRAPRPDLRLATLARLRGAGLHAGVMCSPLMPGITDSRGSIAAVAKAASEADACFFHAGPLFLKPCSLPTFFEFVGQHFPEQLEAYNRRYSRGAFVSPEYSKRMHDLIQSICREYKLGSRNADRAAQPAEQKRQAVSMQPSLPFSDFSE